MGTQRLHTHNRAQLSLGEALAIAGITLDGELHFKVHDGSIRSAQIVEYLEQLLRYIPEKHIVLLWDGSRTHTSNATKTLLKEHADRMTTFRLPPYSPSFNPVELLSAEIKWGKMRGFCPKNQLMGLCLDGSVSVSPSPSGLGWTILRMRLG